MNSRSPRMPKPRFTGALAPYVRSFGNVAPILPERPARPRIDGPRVAVRARHVEHAVERERRRLEAAAARIRARLERPLRGEPAHVARRDLFQRAVPLAGVVARKREPPRGVREPRRDVGGRDAGRRDSRPSARRNGAFEQAPDQRRRDTASDNRASWIRPRAAQSAEVREQILERGIAQSDSRRMTGINDSWLRVSSASSRLRNARSSPRAVTTWIENASSPLTTPSTRSPRTCNGRRRAETERDGCARLAQRGGQRHARARGADGREIRPEHAPAPAHLMTARRIRLRTTTRPRADVAAWSRAAA